MARAQGHGQLDLLDLLERTVVRNAPRVALAAGAEELSYHQLGLETRRLGEHLVGCGILPGDRIALLGRAGPAWVRVFFGALNSGALIVPLDPRLEAADLQAVLADCAPRRVFADTELCPRVQAACRAIPAVEQVHTLEWAALPPGASGPLPRQRGFEDAAVLAYTSGTTRRPRGVLVTVGNLLFQAEQLTALMETSEHDSFVSILPPHHLLELTGGLLGPLFAGARIDYASPLDPRGVIELMGARRATILIGVPLFFHAWMRLLRLGATRGSSPVEALGGRVRMLISGGAPLDREVLRFFQQAGLPLLEGYGLTETSPVIALNRLDAQRPGSVGRPLPEVELRVLGQGEAGEILTRGPHVARGYWQGADGAIPLVDPQGWLHTGDLGRLDGDGFLWITGRVKDLIVLGSGKKVQPAEVEEVLRGDGDLAEVCVVADLHRQRPLAGSERVCAVVVPAPGLAGRFPEPDALRRAVEERVAAGVRGLTEYKRPQRVVLYPGPLPRTATGKLRRAEVTGWVRSLEG